MSTVLSWKTTKKVPYRNYYDNEKVETNGSIHSGMPTPYIKTSTSYSFFYEDQYRGKHTTLSSLSYLKYINQQDA